MNNLDINKIISLLGNVDKNDLEKAIMQANQIMNSKNKDQIIEDLKNKMK